MLRQNIIHEIMRIGAVFFALTLWQNAYGFNTQMGDPVIGPRDLLRIDVFKDDDLSLTTRVSASGDISYPLLKHVHAAGKTAEELALHIETLLKEKRFVRDPFVTITIQEQKSAVVTLYGAVLNPGVVPIYPGTRLRDVLAWQGGIKTTEAGPFIHVQRKTGEIHSINREQLDNGPLFIEETETNPDQKQTTANANITLAPGDQIMVPRAEEFYILGGVREPGRVPITRRLTIADAFGIAGGRDNDAGNTFLWSHDVASASPQLITFTYQQFQNNLSIRNAIVKPGDTLYLTQDGTVFVGGIVGKPGPVVWKPGMTLLEAIHAAGDKSFNAGNDIYLYRPNETGTLVRSIYKYTTIKKHGDNLEVYPGDIIDVSAGFLNIPLTIKKISPFSVGIRTTN